jgi:putative transposase
MNGHRHLYSIVLMCRVLQVACTCFYEWPHKPLSDRAIENQRLLGVIRESYAASGGVYGSNRGFGDLREAGETCSRHRVARIMRTNKIKALCGYKAPRAIAGRPSILSPNRLGRECTVEAPHQAWATAIAYIRTGQGWWYLELIS